MTTDPIKATAALVATVSFMTVAYVQDGLVGLLTMVGALAVVVLIRRNQMEDHEHD